MWQNVTLETLDEMMSGIELNELIAKVTGNSNLSLLPQMLPQVKVGKTMIFSKPPTVYNCMWKFLDDGKSNETHFANLETKESESTNIFQYN